MLVYYACFQVLLVLIYVVPRCHHQKYGWGKGGILPSALSLHPAGDKTLGRVALGKSSGILTGWISCRVDAWCGRDPSLSVPGPRRKRKWGKARCEEGRKMERMKRNGRQEAAGSHGVLEAGDKQLSDGAAGSLNLYF